MSHEEASHANDYRESDVQGNPPGHFQWPGGYSTLPGAVPGFSPYYPPLAATWQPRIDIFEDQGTLLIVAEVPGVKAEQIEVETGYNTLFLRGETPLGSQMLLRYRERTPGAFFRRIPLPPRLDLERAEASCRDGLLRITIPKKPAREGKNIPVKH